MVKETVTTKDPSIKKRRKNSSGVTEPVKQEEDIYKVLFKILFNNYLLTT